MDTSLLAFFINQLELWDPMLHNPLFSVSWGRDIELRPGISIDLASTSFQQNTWGVAGSENALGLPLLARNGNQLQEISLNGAKVTSPIHLAGMKVSYTAAELKMSQRIGTPIDVQKFSALNSFYQMSTDQVVYVGSDEMGQQGLLNNTNPAILVESSPANGTSGSTYWVDKTPAQIVADFNQLINDTWAQSGYSVTPNKIGIPPEIYSYLQATPMSTTATISILNYLFQNNLHTNISGQPLSIVPMKWIVNQGASSKQRMIAYNQSIDFLRFVMAPVQSLQAYPLDASYFRPYIWAWGALELIYPETIGYMDGIGATIVLTGNLPA